MVKGHIQIKLKDEITGKVETHDQDNMVTDAAAYILGLTANMSAKVNSNYMTMALPIARRALGGIFLFDGALEERQDNIHFPMDVHLTGHAGQDANTQDKMAGSLNSVESGRTDTGYTTVWDFSTSQANGTIASLALTNYQAGNNPFNYGQYYSSYYQVDHRYCGIGYDEARHEEYLYSYEQGKIYRKKSFSAVITADSIYMGEEEEVFDFAFSDPGVSYWTVINGYDGYVYAIYYQYQSKKGDLPIRIRRIKIQDGEFKEESELNFTVKNVTSTGSYRMTNDANGNAVISRGFLYFLNYDRNSLYKVNLSNSVDVKEFTFGEKSVAAVYPLYSGGVMGMFRWTGKTSTGSSQTYYSPGYIYPDGKYCCREESTSNSGSLYSYIAYESEKLKRIVMWNSNESRLYYGFATNYLGTICNLSSPVIKTSAQSMKITYTLTDV